MTSFGEMDPDLKEAAQRGSVVDELLSLVGDTKCEGCPIIEGIINNEGSRINKLREVAADKDFFDRALEMDKDLPDGQMGIKIVGVEGVEFVVPSFGGDGSGSEDAGMIFNGMLDYADLLENNLRDLVENKTSGCPGSLKLEGHDMETRQVYKISTCSNPETNQLTGGLVLSKVELEPDV